MAAVILHGRNLVVTHPVSSAKDWTINVAGASKYPGKVAPNQSIMLRSALCSAASDNARF